MLFILVHHSHFSVSFPSLAGFGKKVSEPMRKCRFSFFFSSFCVSFVNTFSHIFVYFLFFSLSNYLDLNHYFKISTLSILLFTITYSFCFFLFFLSILFQSTKNRIDRQIDKQTRVVFVRLALGVKKEPSTKRKKKSHISLF